jgi:hypothetical protein
LDIARNLFRASPRKAEYGVGAVMMSNNPPVSLFQRSPQSMMRDAQAVAVSDITIRAAERVIANRISATEWKLEDEQDVTVGTGEADNSDPAYLAVRDLLATPYRPMPGDPQNTTPRTWAQLSALTARHMGICGSAFWYLDQADALAGTPLGILYLNPSRVTPAIDDNGCLVDWVLDADRRGGGMPLGLSNVVQFTLEPPDFGVFPAGLVETALAKVEIGKLSDRHVSMMLAAGGRLSGILSPKEGFLEQPVYQQLVRDVRTISEAPDAAKRMLILRGPVEYKEAAASPADLDLVALNTLTRDDKLSLWGVPHSAIGIPTAGGLGGGTSKDSDEAILWRNAINPRLRVMVETIQTQLLDRYAALGVVVEMEFETPEFDDQMPAFDMASKAAGQPLTNRERRDLLGLDPFGDSRDDEVWLPAGYMPAYGVRSAPPPMATETYATVYEDPYNEDQSLYAPGKAVDVPAYVQAAARRGLAYYEQGKGGDGLVPATIRAARDMAAGTVSDAKVRLMGPWIARHIVDLEAPQNSDPNHPDYPGAGAVAMLLWGAGTTPEQALRTQRWAEAAASVGKAGPVGIRRQATDEMAKALRATIEGIIAETAAKVVRNHAHIVAKPDDISAYWNDAKVERLILATIEPFARETVREVISQPAKADVVTTILPRLMARVGLRIKSVPLTLLGAIRKDILTAIDQGLSARDAGKLIEDKVTRGDIQYIAERIARTESMRLVNQASIEQLRAAGVSMVQLVDGDDDDPCRERNGSIVDLETALAEVEAEHPNGTLYFLPVTDFDPLMDQASGRKATQEGAMRATVGSMTIPEIRLEPQITINIPEQKATVVNVDVPAPVVNVAAPTVNVAAPEVTVEAPTVNVAAPEVKAGLVQDIRIIEMPARATTQVVVRDPQGRVVGLETATD